MAEPFFACPPHESLKSIDVDGITLIYHRNSGATHVVNEPLPEILDALKNKALGIGQLLEALGIAQDDEAEAALQARLNELVASGLIEQR